MFCEKTAAARPYTESLACFRISEGGQGNAIEQQHRVVAHTIVVFEFWHHSDRAENLILNYAHVGLYVGKNGGLRAEGLEH